MNEENLHSMTGAYALDALEPAEREAFESHLATCAECRDEVAGLGEAAAHLALTASTPPPAGLRARVLAQAAVTAQAPPVRRPVGLSRPPARSTRLVAAVAAALLLVVGGAVGGTLAVRDHRAGQVAMAAQAHMMRIATAPDAVSHDVALGTSHVVMSLEMSAAALVGQDVPMPARRGAVYQLWMVHADGSTAPGPTFTPQRGEVLAIAEGNLSAVTALRVTEEPSGGSAAPTGTVVVSVAL